MGRRTWGPAAVALLGLLVAGCSDPEPRFADPTERASPSASESPSQSEDFRSENPSDTVLAWIDARNDALSSGDTSAAEMLATPSCKACAEYIDGIEDIIGRGGSIDSEGWTVDGLASRGKQTATQATLQGRLIRSAGETDLGDGSKPITYPRTEDDAVFKVVRRGDSWLLNQIFLLA